MDGFLKAAACVLVTLMLYIMIEKQAKDIAILAGTIACVAIAALALSYLQPVISFFSNLQSLGKLDSAYISILLRCTGIAVLSEMISIICIDAGNNALGKIIQLLAGVVVLWLSLPLFSKLLELIEDILLAI